MNLRKSLFRFTWVLSILVGAMLPLCHEWFLDKNEVNVTLPENWKQMSTPEKLNSLDGLLSKNTAFLPLSKIKQLNIRKQLTKMVVGKKDEVLRDGFHYSFGFRFDMGWKELGLLGVAAEDATRIVLLGGEHRHLARAARVRAGEEVWLFDGSGRRCLARVETVGNDRTEAVVLRMEEPEAPRARVALAQCLMEARKLEAVLEKAAELGCSDFIPVVSARSLKASGERADRKLERWKRIAREAAKQCKSRLLTEVHPPRPLEDLLRAPGADRKLFLSEHGGRPLRDIVTAAAGPAEGAPVSALLLIGPAGGWTAGEEREIRQAGFEAASLGRRVLRAETAAVAGAAMIAHFWGE